MTGQARRDRAQQRAEERKTAVASAGNGKPPPGAELARPDAFAALLEEWRPAIEDQFPVQWKINPDAWLRVVLTGMRSSRQRNALARCTRPSLFTALLEAARYGLMPFTDECAIVPYGDQATFIPMAQGFIKMFWQTGQVAGVVVDFIRRGEKRGEDWDLTRGSGGGFFHRPRLVDGDGNPVRPGEPILAYCYLRLRDGSVTEPVLITRWDAEDVMREKSRAWQYAENTGKRDSLWHTNFDAMWLKTAVRRAAKYGPKSAELQELLLVEAREDRTRDDAPPPPRPVAGAGIDWQADINGGNVVSGEVVADPAGDDPGQAGDVVVEDPPPDLDEEPGR